MPQQDLYIGLGSVAYALAKMDGRLQPEEAAALQQLLREELDKLDVPFTKFTYLVDANGAAVNFKGPWAGLRSGICLGLHF